MEKSRKFLIEIGIILAAISLKAKKTGNGIKEYLYEEETTKHISLVLYDLLPLSVKIGMRYEKFHEIFDRNFSAIRNALLGKEELKEEVKKPVKSPRKAKVPAKKTVRTRKVKDENETK